MKLSKSQEKRFDEKLREKLAELEHKQWMDWSKEIEQTENISNERRNRWVKYWCEYKDLPEKVKIFDRVWADKSLKIVKQHLADELARQKKDLKCRSCKHPIVEHHQEIGCDLYDKDGLLLDSCERCEMVESVT